MRKKVPEMLWIPKKPNIAANLGVHRTVGRRLTTDFTDGTDKREYLRCISHPCHP